MLAEDVQQANRLGFIIMRRPDCVGFIILNSSLARQSNSFY